MILDFLTGIGLSFAMLLPLSMKWELEKKITMPAAFLIGVLAGSVPSLSGAAYPYALALQASAVVSISGSLLLWRFYRDPERTPPETPNAVLSPADGRVIYVNTALDGTVPFSMKQGKTFPIDDFVRADVFPQAVTLIGISMNFLDVHINRAPISGRVKLLRRIQGVFLSLKRKTALLQNERMLTVVENGALRVGVVQIASRLVRSIVSFVGEGQAITRGQRIGTIRFGSQVDLILPVTPLLKILVKVGDKVRAGESILAMIEEPGRAATENTGHGKP